MKLLSPTQACAWLNQSPELAHYTPDDLCFAARNGFLRFFGHHTTPKFKLEDLAAYAGVSIDGPQEVLRKSY